MTNRLYSEEQIKEWAEKRADDARRLSRQLLDTMRENERLRGALRHIAMNCIGREAEAFAKNILHSNLPEFTDYQYKESDIKIEVSGPGQTVWKEIPSQDSDIFVVNSTDDRIWGVGGNPANAISAELDIKPAQNLNTSKTPIQDAGMANQLRSKT